MKLDIIIENGKHAIPYVLINYLSLSPTWNLYKTLSRRDALFAVWSFCVSLEESILPAFGGFKHRLRWFQLPPELNLLKKN